MANRGLGSLTLDLITKIGGFTAPLSQAERELDRRASAMSKRAKGLERAITGSLGTIAAGISGFVAGFASVTAVFEGLRNAINFADQLNDFNQRLGISAETLSGWSYAAKQTGTDIDALGVGLKKLARNMSEALDPKSQQAGLFEALGVDVKDAQGNLRSLESILPDIADAFKKLDNETLEASLSMEIFGKSGADLLEFLNQGSDGLATMKDRARELGIELSQDTLTAADNFNDKVGDLQTVTQALFTQLAVELLPTLTKLVEKLTEVAKEGEDGGGIIKWLGDQAKAAAKDIDFLAGSFDVFRDLFGGLIDAATSYYGLLKSIATLDFSEAAQSLAKMEAAGNRVREAAMRDVRAEIASRELSATPDIAGVFTVADGSEGAPMSPKERAAFESRINRFLGGDGDKAKKAKTGKSDEEKEAERLQKAYESLNQSLTERVALFGQEGEAAKVRYEIEHGELQKLTKAQKDELLQRAEKLDMMNAEKELQEKLNDLDKRRTEATKDILADNAFELELLGKTVEQQEILNKLRYAGATANDAYGQSIIESTEALQQQREATESQIELMDEFRSGAVSALTDIVTGAKSAKDAFKDFFDDLARRITQMIAEKWIEQAFGQMGSSSTGSAGGWVGAIASLFGGGRAAGGAVNSGMFYRVNENQPELLSIGGRDFLMMGNQSGMVSPRGMAASGPSITNINVQGTVSRETIKQIDRANGSRAAREMTRTGRR